jgi:alpha-ribazole phosphatase/probable phosphoglycerate mutase
MTDKTARPDAPRRFFFIRHGETDWNREFRYQGSSDVGLNAEGEEQARRAGLRLSKVLPVRVYSSPLKRASRTAEIIMANNPGGAPIELLDDLREISFGSWEGLTAGEIELRDAAALTAWRNAPFSASPEGGETFADVTERSKRAARQIAGGADAGDPAFVIAHGAVLRALIAAFMNIDDINLLWRLRFDNCSISAVDIWGSRPSLPFVNDTHHIRLGDGDIEKLDFPD